jgi:hypothetical protein
MGNRINNQMNQYIETDSDSESETNEKETNEEETNEEETKQEYISKKMKEILEMYTTIKQSPELSHFGNIIDNVTNQLVKIQDKSEFDNQIDGHMQNFIDHLKKNVEHDVLLIDETVDLNNDQIINSEEYVNVLHILSRFDVDKFYDMCKTIDSIFLHKLKK